MQTVLFLASFCWLSRKQHQCTVLHLPVILLLNKSDFHADLISGGRGVSGFKKSWVYGSLRLLLEYGRDYDENRAKIIDLS